MARRAVTSCKHRLGLHGTPCLNGGSKHRNRSQRGEAEGRPQRAVTSRLSATYFKSGKKKKVIEKARICKSIISFLLAADVVKFEKTRDTDCEQMLNKLRRQL
ncbi:hypothetical protein RRG08_038884 [Elysia crispata]|uniref:Uncharacterized protein n=1 Tax=Elysia crispata TaxID=231223 RepID=A0AAE1CTQ4_9GAST|nr:hypothetical protein RRG08_038884 [Elysia crispata]